MRSLNYNTDTAKMQQKKTAGFAAVFLSSGKARRQSLGRLARLAASSSSLGTKSVISPSWKRW